LSPRRNLRKKRGVLAGRQRFVPAASIKLRECGIEFGMLLDVGNSQRLIILAIFGIALLFFAGAIVTRGLQTSLEAQQAAPATAPPTSPAPIGQSAATAPSGSSSGAQTSQSALNVVVLDPAHGGTDLGARGTGGIQESEIDMEFVAEVRKALEQQGFQVVQTRQGATITRLSTTARPSRMRSEMRYSSRFTLRLRGCLEPCARM